MTLELKQTPVPRSLIYLSMSQHKKSSFLEPQSHKLGQGIAPGLRMNFVGDRGNRKIIFKFKLWSFGLNMSKPMGLHVAHRLIKEKKTFEK